MRVHRTLVPLAASVGLALAVTMTFAVQDSPQHKVLFEKAKFTMETKGDLKGAIALFEEIIKKYPSEWEYAAQALLQIGLCYEKLGLDGAQGAYQRLIKEYPGQTAAVAVAQERLDNLLRAASSLRKGERETSIRSIPVPARGLELYRVSPDGRHVSYIDWKTGDIGVWELLTGSLRLLTHGGKGSTNYTESPTWSMDSAKLAFIRYRPDNVVELSVVALDGSPERVLLRAEGKDWVSPQAWSPDGKRVLAEYHPREGARQVILVDVADGSVQALKTSPRALGGSFRFSADGLTIAYSRPTGPESKRDIFLLSVDGSREIPLVQHPADDVPLGWLPDRRGILFSSDRRGTRDLWALRIEQGRPEGEPTLIKQDIGMVRAIGLTKTGAFYYQIPSPSTDVYTASLDPKTGNIAGERKREPLTWEGHNRSPAWSPDGKHLAYVSIRPGVSTWVPCIYSADTGTVRELHPGKTLTGPAWTPDGRHLYFTVSTVDGGGIYRVDVASGEATPFLSPLGPGIENRPTQLRVSADQKWMVYVRRGGKVESVVRRDARSGQEQELDRTSFGVSTAALSPDGSRLAWVLKTDERTRVLKVMAFPDGTPKEIVKYGTIDFWSFNIDWSPDGRFIYYCDLAPARNRWHLHRVPADGGETQDLGPALELTDQFSIHPDGSRITFTDSAASFEPARIWVMENFLPARK